MRDSVVVKNYARALLEASLLEEGGLAKVQSDLDFLLKAWKEIKNTYILFANSYADVKAKLRLWHGAVQIMSEHDLLLSDITLGFMEILISNQRVKLFGFIKERLRKLVLEKDGITEVCVDTACELPPEEKAAIVTDLKGMLNAKIQVLFSVDHENIAGMIIGVGDMVADMSLRNRLNRLRNFVL